MTRTQCNGSPSDDRAAAGFTLTEFAMAGSLLVIAAMGFMGTIVTSQVAVRATGETNKANSVIISIVEEFRRDCSLGFDTAMTKHAGVTVYDVDSTTSSSGTVNVNRSHKTSTLLVDNVTEVDTTLVNARATYTANATTTVSTETITTGGTTTTGSTAIIDYDTLHSIGQGAVVTVAVLQDETAMQPPLDLNGDGDYLDEYVPPAELQAAVLRVRATWSGVMGRRSLEFTTIMARGEFE